MSAISKLDLRRNNMDSKNFSNQKKYNSSLYLLDNLKENKLIKKAEYDQANKLLIKKYKPMIQS